MSRPKFVQARKTTLSAGISGSETTSIKLKTLKDLYGNALAMSNFGSIAYITFAPGTDNEEIVSATGFTVNTDGSVTFDTGIVRKLKGVSDYTTDGVGNPHAAGTVVVVSNNPQMYEGMLDYMEALALAGVGDAGLTSAGVVEEATTAEIDADTGVGSTLRRLMVNPEYLASSKYGQRLPSVPAAAFLDVITGMIFDYAGSSAPSGFLLCDGSAVANDTYPELAAILLGKFGLGTAVTFTADAPTDVVTSVSHGLSDGDILFVASSAADLPAGLLPNTIYYVITATTNTFQLSTTSGGSAVDITDAGTGTHSYYTTFKVPDLRGTVMIGAGEKTLAYSGNGAAVTPSTITKTVSAVTSTDDYIQTSTAHGLANGDSVIFTGTVPGGVSINTVYFVSVLDSTSFYLYTTHDGALNGGNKVNITSTTTGATVYIGGSLLTINTAMDSGLFATGTPVVLSTAGTLPTGLTATTYYLIRVSDTTVKLAYSAQAAALGDYVVFSAVGAGEFTLTRTLSSRTLGDSGGEESHTLVISEMPSHHHIPLSVNGAVSNGDRIGRDENSGSNEAYNTEYSNPGNNPYISNTGGNAAHNNMPPFVVVNKIIKT